MEPYFAPVFLVQARGDKPLFVNQPLLPLNAMPSRLTESGARAWFPFSRRFSETRSSTAAVEFFHTTYGTTLSKGGFSDSWYLAWYNDRYVEPNVES